MLESRLLQPCFYFAGLLGRLLCRSDGARCTPNLPTKIQDFRGFDSSIILTLRDGVIMSIGNFLESLSQAILVGIILLGRLGVCQHDAKACVQRRAVCLYVYRMHISWMYMHVHRIYTYMCVCVCTCTCTCTCTRMYVCVYIYIYICVHTLVCVYVYAYVYAYVYVCVC